MALTCASFEEFLADIRGADPVETATGMVGTAEEWIPMNMLRNFWDWAGGDWSQTEGVNILLQTVYAKGLVAGYIHRRLEEDDRRLVSRSNN